MKKVIFCFLFIAWALLCNAQTIDTSYQLLWFKGKEIKPNVLLTPQGTTVTYNPSKGSLKIQGSSGAGKQMDNMLSEINKTPDRINQTMQKVNGIVQGKIAPYYAKPIEDAFEEVSEIYSAPLSNTIEIQQTGFASFSAQSNSQKTSGQDVEKLIIQVQNAIKEAETFLAKHKNENIEVPMPPAKDYRYCSQCDQEAKKNYKQQLKDFNEKLIGEESNLASKLISAAHDCEISQNEKAMEASRSIWQLITQLMNRGEQKAKKLLEQYGKDPLRGEAAMQSALSIERQRQLLGSAGDVSILPDITQCIKARLDWIEKAIDEYDYSIALDLTMIISSIRQYVLLGGGEDMHLLQKAIDFNNFKMTIRVSGKLSGKDFYQLANLEGTNYFSALPDPNDTITCRLKWVLVAPDNSGKYMRFKLTDAKCLGNGGELVYTGTKDWISSPPKLRVDFCSKGNDTAEVYSFQPYNFKESWKLPYYGEMEVGLMNNVLLGCFMDVDRLKKEVKNINTEKIKTEMMQQYDQFKKNYQPGGTTNISQMQKMAVAFSSSSKINELIHSAPIGSYLIKPGVQNKNKLVFKERLNGKELFPQNPSTEYAWFDITLEQESK